MSSPRLLVTAKAPRPGHTKTRMCPPLGLQTAARLGHAFLTDAVTRARTVDPSAGLLAPIGDADELTALFPGVPVIAQQGTGLAAALEHAVAGGALLVSGDAPSYPAELIRRGLESTADLVLGPSLDGGYCLIGMRRFHPAPFRDIAWSTGAVLEQTLGAARVAGLEVELLDPAPDIDTVDDLAACDLTQAPATAALLAEPDLAPFLPKPVPAVRTHAIAHETPWRRLVIDRLEDGRDYSYLETPRAVWVVPVTDDGDTMFVRQYRHPVRAHPLEMPAGSIEPARRRRLLRRASSVRRWAASPATCAGWAGSTRRPPTCRCRASCSWRPASSSKRPRRPPRRASSWCGCPSGERSSWRTGGELCEAQSALAVILAGHAALAGQPVRG